MPGASRRDFLRQAAAVSLAFASARALAGCGGPVTEPPPPERELGIDPKRVFNLPPGFSYRVVSRTGDRMDDGFLVPASPDAMATFPGPEGKTILIRNHELTPKGPHRGPFGRDNALFPRLDRAKTYDAGRGLTPGLGGTTTVVYDTKKRKLERQFLSLAGTWRNCAGGPTPWQSWLTCEECVVRPHQPDPREPESIAERDHGYVFEVPATAEPALADPVPLAGLGRFNHEAAAVDPRTGIVYETEDRSNGLFYRFVPDHPGELARGGRLQALRLRDRAGAETMNWTYCEKIPVGKPLAAGWVDLDEAEAPRDDLRFRGRAAGAAVFARGEGLWFGTDECYFACTSGGPRRKGQIWRYRPGEEMLELFLEPDDGSLLEGCDNLTIAPWGDLILCEDSWGPNYLVGVTPEGRLYKLGRNVHNSGELAGAVFSPDGSTLFVNLQSGGITLAITGPDGRMGRPRI